MADKCTPELIILTYRVVSRWKLTHGGNLYFITTRIVEWRSVSKMAKGAVGKSEAAVDQWNPAIMTHNIWGND